MTEQAEKQRPEKCQNLYKEGQRQQNRMRNATITFLRAYAPHVRGFFFFADRLRSGTTR